MSRPAAERRSNSPIGALLAGACLSLAAAAAPAFAITITPGRLDKYASVGTCAGGKFDNCVSHAYLFGESLRSNDPYFKQAFDAWKGLNGENGKWKLVEGGALPASSLGVMEFYATADDVHGGMVLDLNWTYRGGDQSSYRWTQGVFANYVVDGTPTGTRVPEYFKMDVSPDGTPCNDMDVAVGVDNRYCPPQYPFQYGNRALFDNPHGPWPDASFDAYAFLSKINYATHELTIYEGINYGFVLSATPFPEPETWLLMIAGFGAAGLALRRQPLRAGPNA